MRAPGAAARRPPAAPLAHSSRKLIHKQVSSLISVSPDPEPDQRSRQRQSAELRACDLRAATTGTLYVDLAWPSHAWPHSGYGTGYPHTPTQGNTTTLKRRQGAHAPGVLYRAVYEANLGIRQRQRSRRPLKCTQRPRPLLASQRAGQTRVTSALRLSTVRVPHAPLLSPRLWRGCHQDRAS